MAARRLKGSVLYAVRLSIIEGLNKMATLNEFHAFHSMVCNPLSAQKCIEAFTNGTHGQEEQEQGINYRSELGRSSSSGGGCILFMPSSYRQISSRSDQLKEIKLHDATRSLNIVSYYALVIVSLTGLSTLLGLTDIIEVTDFSRSGSGSGSSARMEIHEDVDSIDTDSGIPIVIWPIVENHSHSPSSETHKSKRTESSLTRNDLLKSKVDPQVVVDDVVFEYIVERHRNLGMMREKILLNEQAKEMMGRDTSINTHTSMNDEVPTVEIKLVRRFEYYFRLVGLSVIMLHFTSTTATTSSSSKIDEGSNADGGNMDSDEVLHLVEVYYIRNPTLRAVMSLLFSNLNRLSQFLFRAKDEGKLSAAHLKCD